MRIRLLPPVVAISLLSSAILAQTPTLPHALAAQVVSVKSQASAAGSVLFTGDGKALYMLSYDAIGTSTTPAQSNCTNKCLGAWPPLLASTAAGPFATAGDVQAEGLGTIARTDVIAGSTVYQVTYFGRPLYMFVADQATGQSKGQNVAAFLGIWNLVDPSGRPAPGAATVRIEQSSNGEVLASPTAFDTYRSLYMLTSDPPQGTACTDSCLRFWPPLLTSGPPVAATGVDASKLGTITRADGTLQVTYNGMPVYYFAFDLSPGEKSGDTNGENNVDPFLGPPAVGGIWYTVSAAGVPVPAPAPMGSMSTLIGPVLTFAGAPVYALSADTPTSSACTGLCARIWPPVITSGTPQIVAGSGLSAAGIGTIKRPDGTVQVTYFGHPLYTFSKDLSGIGGQAITAFGGTWRLMQPSGTPSPTGRPVIATTKVQSISGGKSAAFTVSFSSAAPGVGSINFGTGPGCAGLVEMSTGDAGAGTTSHSVDVTGNDLPGTVGDIGIQPGVTYWYEVVTSGPTGQEVNDNAGKCYSVTMPKS